MPILSLLWSLMLGAAHGIIEGVYINQRTAERKEPMEHTWSVLFRFLTILSVTVVTGQFRDGTTIIMFLSLWFAHLPAHRFVLNSVRGSRFKVKWHDMGRGWYDAIWVNLFVHDIEKATDDDEKRAFFASSIIELAISIALCCIVQKLHTP